MNTQLNYSSNSNHASIARENKNCQRLALAFMAAIVFVFGSLCAAQTKNSPVTSSRELVLDAQNKTATDETEKLTAPLKVMSFNIRFGSANDGENRWENRDQLVLETIKVFDPDLLGGQEVLKFQADFLKEELPDYEFHGVGRDDGKDSGELVPVLFKKDRFELVDSGHFWLSETPGVAGSKSWDSSLPRMASWVRLRDKKVFNDNNESVEFVFLNTHFDHRGKTARLESARLIKGQLDAFVDQGFPVIISGDFNTTEDGEPYAALVGGQESNENGTAFVDSYRVANPDRTKTESTFSGWNGNRAGSRIDWIIHSSDFTTLQAVINYTCDGERYPSDHYPVQAVLRLKFFD